MNALHQELVLGLAGQVFLYDPPEGRPSGTPTVQVFDAFSDDGGEAEDATSGACSVDTVNTTISAASFGDTTVTVASATAIARGRRYLVTNTNGSREWIECAGIAGTTVTLRHPLLASYAAGSTFQGCRISIAVDSSWGADDGNLSDGEGAGFPGFRLRWDYTVDGVATIGVSFADLVRYPAKNLITGLDVDDAFPGWIDRLGPDHREDQGAALIAEAFTAVRMDALGDAQAVRRVRSTEVIAELTKYRANVKAFEAQLLAGSATPDQLAAAEKLYAQRYAQLLREPKVPVDQSGGGAAGEPQRLPLFRR